MFLFPTVILYIFQEKKKKEKKKVYVVCSFLSQKKTAISVENAGILLHCVLQICLSLR